MKKINPLKLSFTFAGCFLGAGYVSGQELWQFFGSFGKLGIIGAAVAAILLALFGIILIRYVQLTGIYDMDKIVIRSENPILRTIFIILEIFFLFGVFVIMTAGVGALINQLFGLPQYIGSLIFCIIAAIVASTGITGIITAFSITVPSLVVMCIGLFIYSVATGGVHRIDFGTSTNTNPLLSNWFISAIVFVSYNLFASIGILAPIGKRIKDKKSVYSGIALGGVLLFCIACTILLSLSMYSSSVKAELPMLELSSSINIVLYYIFAVLLFGGMFGTSVSSLFAVDEFMKSKFKINRAKSVGLIIALSTLSFVSSLFGFGKLISIIYPICGYLGIVAIILIIINFIKVKKQGS